MPFYNGKPIYKITKSWISNCIGGLTIDRGASDGNFSSSMTAVLVSSSDMYFEITITGEYNVEKIGVKGIRLK